MQLVGALHPSCTFLSISFPPLEISETCIQIFNAEGKIVYEQKNDSNQNVVADVSTFTSGIYFVKINDGGKLYTKKFAKE